VESNDSPHERATIRAFFLFCALPFLLVFPYFHPTNNPNENVRTYMTIALVEQQSVEIDTVVARYGWTNDMAKVPDPRRPSGVHFTSVKAPAVSMLGVPVYAALRLLAPRLGLTQATDTSSAEQKIAWFRATTWALRIFAIQIPALAFLVLLERHLRAVTASLRLRLTTVTAVGLGTNYLAYALMFASHTWVAIAGYTTFAIIETEYRKRGRSKQDHARRWTRAALAGACATFTTALEYQSLFVTALLCLYGAIVFYRPKQLVAFAVGALGPVGMVLWFQWKAYFNPFSPGHKFVENPVFAAGHDKGLFGIQPPSLAVLKALLFSQEWGVFGLSPALLLALLVVPALLRVRLERGRRSAIVVAFCAFALPAIAISGYYLPRGGWTVGPRLLGGISPFLGYLATVGVEGVGGAKRVRRAAIEGLYWGLTVTGVAAVGLVGLLYNTLPPDELTRPFRQFTLPLMRAGFAPHHVGEWFGIQHRAVYYAAVAGVAAAALIALVGPSTRGQVLGRRRAWAPVFLVLTSAAGIALGLQSSWRMDDENSVAAHNIVRSFAAGWEPVENTRIAELRRLAAKSPAPACIHREIARLERLVYWDDAAAQDDASAASCPSKPSNSSY
jgi:hypothetical protein